MKGYRKPDGSYIEVSDSTPTSDSLTPVALRPSIDHVFADVWRTDPMDAAVCWRLKMTAEVHADQDTELDTFFGSTGGKAFKAMLLVGEDKGLWTLSEFRAKCRML